MKHDYRFLYHYNTYSERWAAFTADSVGHYFNLDYEKGNFAFGDSMEDAAKALDKLLEEKLSV